MIGVPSGMQPRAAVIYMTVAALECAALCGAAPGLHTEIDSAAAFLERVVPTRATTSRPRPLAGRLQGTVPVIHGADPTMAPARRWKSQLNENAKAPPSPRCFRRRTTTRSAAGSAITAAPSGVFLEDPDQHPRIRRRIELTAAELEDAGAPYAARRARGREPAGARASLVLLGDLVSVYLAALGGVDPTPVEPIDRFKASLAQP